MRRLLCLFTILAGVLVTAGPALAGPVDLIANGGFENGFTGWTDTTTLISPYCAWKPSTRPCRSVSGKSIRR